MRERKASEIQEAKRDEKNVDSVHYSSPTYFPKKFSY